MHQYTPNLGQLCDEQARRDAIHIAVAPVEAFSDLHPGDHVAIEQDGKAHLRCPSEGDKVGIVDPFLLAPVLKGERFWLFLYPGTVTSLRHVWTHPAFTIKVPQNGVAS